MLDEFSARAIVAERVDIQSSLERADRFTAVIDDHAGNIDGGGWLTSDCRIRKSFIRYLH